MKSFSQRQGYEGPKAIQFESMDSSLRNGLWNALDLYFWSTVSPNKYRIGMRFDCLDSHPTNKVITGLWMQHFKRSLDTMPTVWIDLRKQLRLDFFACAWNRAYDFIEYFASRNEEVQRGLSQEFATYCNKIMEQERSAYRFVKGVIAPISNGVESNAIEEALATPYDAVKNQIYSALEKLSTKPKPDLRNSIKDSIGAVETAARLAANDPKATLGKLLPVLKSMINLHPAQVEGFQKLYGYTSDDDSGIRHGMMDKDDLTVDDARYMLVTCSAFANYLLRLAERAKVLTPPR